MRRNSNQTAATRAAATCRKVRNGSRAGEDKKGPAQQSRIPEKTRAEKSGAVLFLESLLKEAKEREAESEKARPAVDGESWIRPGRDTFEHSEDPEELWCESYEDIMGIVRMVGKWKANILYQIANAILRDYHEKKLDEDGVGELFGLCCQKCKDTGRRHRQEDGAANHGDCP